MHAGLICTILALVGQDVPLPGSISGIVLNGSHENAPVPGAEVVLRVRVDGDWIVAGETMAGADGRFLFDNIPADPEYLYLPGANWESVHYPGRKVRLNATNYNAHSPITVHDAVKNTDPLIIRRHEIILEPEPDALSVTETIIVDNPTKLTYVGQPAKDGGRATTFRLSIPSNFVRTTFHKEFFGRRFVLIDGKLVTDIPWTPGSRELKFTYVVPRDDRQHSWSRTVDLPTSELKVAVHNERTDDLTTNLERIETGDANTVAFASRDLPPGRIIKILFANSSTSFAVYARWIALVVLASAIAGTVFAPAIRRRLNSQPVRSSSACNRS